MTIRPVGYRAVRIIDSSSLYATRVTRIQGVVLRESVGVVTFGHATTKMAVIQFDSQWR